MATSTIAQSPAGSRLGLKIGAFILGAILFGVLGLAGITVGWFYYTAKDALPQVDGAIALTGLSAPVTVIRDAQGMPHITAANLHDLFFAQGYVTAQDRLWQMDVSRRFGQGEIAEIFGAKLIALDKRQRTLQIKAAVAGAEKALSAEQREYLDAYSAGVNALIAHQEGRLPIEFHILGYTPRRWTVADSLTIGANISQSLTSQYGVEYNRDTLVRKGAPELIADLYPNVSWRDRPPSAISREDEQRPLTPAASNSRVPSSEVKQDEASIETWISDIASTPAASIPCDTCAAGSNNWVVSGAHTVSGKPLLSNDMHLDYSIPNVWYEVHLKAGAFEVAGVSFPGLPFVVAGHNQRIAWGYTNLGADVQDLYVEKFNGNGEYETPSGWQKPQHVREVIKVKRQGDVAIDTLITRHGPVISSLFPGESRQLALKWTIYDPAAFTLRFFEIDSAQNWQQFRSAVSSFGGASQNVVYADVDGHIGYQAVGSIPIRASGDGISIVPGNDDAHEWLGYIPFDKLPSVFDPPSGIIATANGRVAPDGYPYLLASQWGSPYRTERIYKVLEASPRDGAKKFSAADMLALEMDAYSEFDRLSADHLVYAIDHAKNPSKRARQAADLMRGWDGQMSVDSVAATIETVSRRKLTKLFLEPKFGADWDKYQWFESPVALEKMLQTKPQRWVPANYASFDDVLVAAVEQSVAEEPRDFKSAAWKWGEKFPVEVAHPIFGYVPMLKKFAGPGVRPQSGSGSLTVKAAGRNFGASERLTMDISNFDASTLNIVTGESGQLFSKHYMDQWQAWYTGNTFAWPFSQSAVNSAAAHTLVLSP